MFIVTGDHGPQEVDRAPPPRDQSGPWGSALYLFKIHLFGSNRLFLSGPPVLMYSSQTLARGLPRGCLAIQVHFDRFYCIGTSVLQQQPLMEERERERDGGHSSLVQANREHGEHRIVKVAPTPAVGPRCSRPTQPWADLVITSIVYGHQLFMAAHAPLTLLRVYLGNSRYSSRYVCNVAVHSH